MNYIKVKDYDELSKIACEIIVEQVKNKPNSVLGLATGSTPIGLYKNLIRAYKNKKVDFEQVHTVNLDEYIGLDKENKNSYNYFMNNMLFNYVNINHDNINIPNGVAQNIEKECDRYSDIVKGFSEIDIQILGLGLDGHIGFNEPNSFFNSKTHIVELDESTIKANSKFFDKGKDIPNKAITMGIGEIFRATHILLLVSGKEKACILNKALKGKITPKVPASILQLHPNLTVITDI